MLALSERKYSDYFNIEKKIGRGGFASVYKVTNKLDDMSYALKKIKIITKEDTNSSEEIDKVLKEAKTLSTLNHPNIVRYYGSWTETKKNNNGMIDTESENVITTKGNEVSTGGKNEYCDINLDNTENNQEISHKRDYLQRDSFITMYSNSNNKEGSINEKLVESDDIFFDKAESFVTNSVEPTSQSSLPNVFMFSTPEKAKEKFKKVATLPKDLVTQNKDITTKQSIEKNSNNIIFGTAEKSKSKQKTNMLTIHELEVHETNSDNYEDTQPRKKSFSNDISRKHQDEFYKNKEDLFDDIIFENPNKNTQSSHKRRLFEPYENNKRTFSTIIAEKNNLRNLKKETKIFIDTKNENNNSNSNSKMTNPKNESADVNSSNKLVPRKPSFFDVESYTTRSESSNYKSKRSNSNSIYNSETDNMISLENKPIKKRLFENQSRSKTPDSKIYKTSDEDKEFRTFAKTLNTWNQKKHDTFKEESQPNRLSLNLPKKENSDQSSKKSNSESKKEKKNIQSEICYKAKPIKKFQKDYNALKIPDAKKLENYDMTNILKGFETPKKMGSNILNSTNVKKQPIILVNGIKNNRSNSDKDMAQPKNDFKDHLDLKDPTKELHLFIQTELCQETLENYLERRDAEIYKFQKPNVSIDLRKTKSQAESGSKNIVYINDIKMKKLQRKDISQKSFCDNRYLFEAFNLAYQLINAMEYQHIDEKLIHRDLKPSNIFINKVQNGSLEQKIGDFGLVKKLKTKTISPSPLQNINSMGIPNSNDLEDQFNPEGKLDLNKSQCYSLNEEELSFDCLDGKSKNSMDNLASLSGHSKKGDSKGCLDKSNSKVRLSLKKKSKIDALKGQFNRWSTQLRDDDITEDDSKENFQDKESAQTNDIGTRLYMSPEQTYSTIYDEKSDIYSQGLVLYRIFQPIYTTMEKYVTLENAKNQNLNSAFTQNFKYICNTILAMLIKEPSKRPNLNEIRATQINEELDCSLKMQVYKSDTFITENNDILTLTDTSEGTRVYINVRIKPEWEIEHKIANLFQSNHEILFFFNNEVKCRYSVDLKEYRIIIKEDNSIEQSHPIKQGYNLEFINIIDLDFFVGHLKGKRCILADVRKNRSKDKKLTSKSTSKTDYKKRDKSNENMIKSVNLDNTTPDSEQISLPRFNSDVEIIKDHSLEKNIQKNYPFGWKNKVGQSTIEHNESFFSEISNWRNNDNVLKNGDIDLLDQKGNQVSGNISNNLNEKYDLVPKIHNSDTKDQDLRRNCTQIKTDPLYKLKKTPEGIFNINKGTNQNTLDPFYTQKEYKIYEKSDEK